MTSTTPGETTQPRGRLLLVLLCVTLAARFCSLVRLHAIVWDEIEFYRATDWIGQRLVPFRDFWEHHTPLQWFLFAPLATLIRSPGPNAIVAMRVAQIPLWIAIFAAVARWMRDGAIDSWSRRASVVLALSSSILMVSGIEFRVDVLGTLLFLLGLVALDRSDRSSRYAFGAGVLFCLAGFANLRLGPLLALTVLLARIVRTDERRWEGNRRVNWTYAGVIVTFVSAAVYFVVTNSWRIAFRRLWIENFLGDRRAQGVPWQFVDRMLWPFGVRLDVPGVIRFDPGMIDIAAVALLIVGGIGVVRALWAGRRAPDRWFFLAFVQVSNFLFLGALKFIYLYHLQLLLVLMVPFVAREIERAAASTVPRRRHALTAFLVIAALLSSADAILRGNEGDSDYQDTVMRGADRYTARGSKVFDGVGWALRRRPAYEYWFLPNLAKVHEHDGIFRPYLVTEMVGDPPAAVIMDFRTRWWLNAHRPLSEFVVRHYLPAWRDLWLPGLSGVVSRESSDARWVAPADGDYRIYASEGLVYHPWFRLREYGMNAGRDSGKLQIDLRRFGPAPAGLIWKIDGRPVSPVNGALRLQRKQIVSVSSSSAVPIAIFVVPANQTTLFRQPPPGVTLDGVYWPRMHVPDFGRLGHALLFWR